MAVAGLPAAVNSLLSTLLADNQVTSWKITGEGETSVVVLRLSPSNAQPGSVPSALTGHWRRKPPGQVRRDQRRAEQHKKTLHKQQHQQQQQETAEEQKTEQVSIQNVENINANTEINIFTENENTAEEDNSKSEHKIAANTNNGEKTTREQASTHSIIDSAENLTHQMNLMCTVMPTTLTPTAPYSAREAPVRDGAGVGEACRAVAYSDGVSTTHNTSRARDTLQGGAVSAESGDSEGERDYLEQLAYEGDFIPQDVKERVSTITKLSVQRSLRDITRNRQFNKMVLDTRLGARCLICESEDIVFAYCLRSDQRIWFLKNRPWRLTEEQRDMLYCLRSWDPADLAPFTDILGILHKDLRICLLMIRHFLG